MTITQTRPDASTISLLVNYRSQANIVAFANAVIEPAGLPISPQQADRAAGLPVRLLELTTRDASLCAMAEEVAAGGKSYQKETAILVRTNALADMVREALARVGVPVRSAAAELRWWTEPSFRDFLRALRLIANPHDVASAILLFGVRLGAERMSLVRSWRDHHRVSWMEAIGCVAPNMIGWWREATHHLTDTAPKLVDAIRFMSEQPSEDLGQLLTKATQRVLNRWVKAMGQDWATATVAEFVEWVDTIKTAEATQDSLDTKGVEVLTVHSAKGLEWPRVYVCGCVEGTMPILRHADDRQVLDEELRILYVAITRARDDLTLVSWLTEPSRSGIDKPAGLSRFLSPVKHLMK